MKKLKRIIWKFLRLNKENDQAEINKSTYWQDKARAKIYHSQTSKPDYNTELNRIFVDHIEGHISTKSSVLDVGAGTGVLSLEMARRGYNVTATDISKSMLEYLKSQNSLIDVVSGDIFNVSFNKKFDCVVSRWFIPHFRNWAELIKHISDNFLSDSGFLVFDLPQEEHIIKSKNLNHNILPSIFGYDHSEDASETYFYGMSSYSKLELVAENSGLELIDRIPHGILKSNLFLANSIGEADYKAFSLSLNIIAESEDGRRVLRVLDKYLTPNIDSSLIHGSTVIMRKKQI
jgi:SAM-dependent methyltransferase